MLLCPSLIADIFGMLTLAFISLLQLGFADQKNFSEVRMSQMQCEYARGEVHANLMRAGFILVGEKPDVRINCQKTADVENYWLRVSSPSVKFRDTTYINKLMKNWICNSQQTDAGQVRGLASESLSCEQIRQVFLKELFNSNRPLTPVDPSYKKTSTPPK